MNKYEQERLPLKIRTDFAFFSLLRRRFMIQHQLTLDAFVSQNSFKDHFVLGVHVRAGNGEQGDFTDKQRGIADLNVWCNRFAQLMLNFVDTLPKTAKPALLFVATDTVAVVEMLRVLTNKNASKPLRVIALPQTRTE